MSSGWWILMIVMIIGVFVVMYGLSFLIWLSRYGGAPGVRKEIERRFRNNGKGH